MSVMGYQDTGSVIIYSTACVGWNKKKQIMQTGPFFKEKQRPWLDSLTIGQ